MTEFEVSISRMLCTPYDEGMLTHRDFFGQDWGLVFKTPDRFLMMWGRGSQGMHLVWLTRADGQIVRAKRVSESETDSVYDEFGRHMLAEERDQLERMLRVGVPHPQTLKAFLKENHWTRPLLNYQETGPNESTTWYQVIRMPSRAAEVLLVATVSEGGMLQEWTILEGEAARRKDEWCVAQIYKKRRNS